MPLVRASILFILGFMGFGNLANAEQIDSGSLIISPSQPSQSWNASRKLYPGESVSLSVTVESSGSANGKNFELEGTPSPSFSGSATLWTDAGGGGTSFNFQALNAGNLPGSDTVTVSATWKEVRTSEGGGEGGGESEDEPLDTIEGWATGFAESDRPIFSWTFNPRLQFADGQSFIVYSVSGSGEGWPIDMNLYSVSSDQSWTVESDGLGLQSTSSGRVKSSQPGKGKLKVLYQNIEQGVSADEIGFAELDLAIAKFSGQSDLAEDRLPGGETASSPHEMDPGSTVIAPVTGSGASSSRSKLTLKGNGGNSEGTFTLKVENLANAAIYTSPSGGAPITTYTWSSATLPQNLYVGATPFASGAAAQDGTIKLTYKRPLASGSSEFELQDSVRVRLLPIEVKKVWSDQFPGVEANFLPGGTGLGNKRYIFMGAAQSNNFDGKAHVKARVSVGGSPELRNRILWRIAKGNGSGGYTPMSGDSSYDTSGEIVTITRDYPDDDPDQNYVLVAGYDADGDGYLFSSEINFIPKYTEGGQEHTYQFKVISSARYNDARADILNWASNSSVAFPQGSVCLNAFATETTPTGATSEPTTIDRLEYGLDHPVGVLFKSSQNSNGGIPNAGPGDSITAVFSPVSRMCSDVAESTTFNNWLASKLDPYAADVVAYFSDPANDGENTVTFVFQFSTVNASTGKEEGIEFTSDPDLFLAIGKGTASVEATVVVHRSLYVESLTLNGSLHDLYDFNYDGAESVFVKPASSVQAGYNTLGVGGRVYKSRVDFDDSPVPIQYLFQN